MRSTALLLLLAATLAQAEDGAALAERLGQLDLAKASAVQATPTKSFANLDRECDEHDSWTGLPLPKFGGLRLKCSSDQNRVEKLLQFPDHTVLFEAKAAPASGLAKPRWRRMPRLAIRSARAARRPAPSGSAAAAVAAFRPA